MMDLYLTLLSSLPEVRCPVSHKDDDFEAQSALSEPQMMMRLSMLDEARRAELALLLSLCPLVKYEPNPWDVQEWKQQFEKLKEPEARRLARWFVELASVLAAIRTREFEPDQSDALPLYPGRWGWVIKTHWHDQYFALDTRFPAIKKWTEWAHDHQWKQIEKDALLLAWSHMDQIALEKPFSFTALAVYWLKWHWVQQWNERANTTGRFANSLNATLDQLLKQSGEERVI
jgi:hypothetical protein